jgi:hypothetical protein
VSGSVPPTNQKTDRPTVPGDEAFRPLDKGGCPLVKAAN